MTEERKGEKSPFEKKEDSKKLTRPNTRGDMNWNSGRDSKEKDASSKFDMLSEKSVDIDNVLRKAGLKQTDDEMEEIMEVMSDPESDISHVSVAIDDALRRKVEKEVPMKEEAKKQIALHSGLILSKDIINEVKIDKSLD